LSRLALVVGLALLSTACVTPRAHSRPEERRATAPLEGHPREGLQRPVNPGHSPFWGLDPAPGCICWRDVE